MAPPRRQAVWRRVDGGGPEVALTFDDGDRPDAWERILDALAGLATRATFFVLGMRVLEHPDLAARTVAAGHAIGSHGFDHARLTDLSPDEVRWRLEQDREAWAAVAAATPLPWFRPPYGAYDESTLGAAAGAGYTHTVLWDVDPEDWREPGSDVIATRVLRRARGGSIVDLHVVDQTADALPTVVGGLRARGMRPVTIPRLLAAVSDLRPPPAPGRRDLRPRPAGGRSTTGPHPRRGGGRPACA